MRQLYDAHGEDSYTLDQMRSRVAELLRHGQAIVILSGGAPVGYAVLQDRGDHMFVKHFVIGDGARRAGLGRAAFAALEAAYFPARPVRLDASIKVPGPRAFWEALGFKAYAYAMRRDPPEAAA